MSGNRHGFTLLEVVVALTVTGLALTVASELFRQLARARTDLQNAERLANRTVNARRWVADALEQAVAGGGGEGRFSGHRDRLAFSSYLLTADGWHDRTRVELSLAGRTMTCRIGESQFDLAEDVTSVAFDYWPAADGPAGWVASWSKDLELPRAVRVRMARVVDGRAVADTLVFLVKERG